MAGYRFYIPNLQQQLSSSDATVTLPDDEAHHARAVLRLEEGNSVSLFDGKGAVATGRLTRVTKAQVQVLVADRFVEEQRPPIHLTLCTAVPKGDRAEQLIDQASQLNAARVEWLDCDHSVVRPREGGQKMEKWRRQAIESSKQCGRPFLMEIAEPISAAKKLQEVRKSEPTALDRVFWMEPGGQTEGNTLGEAMKGLRQGTVTAFIGPEGGWSDAEIAHFEACIAEGKIQRVRLTSTILRIETACAAVAAAVMCSAWR